MFTPVIEVTGIKNIKQEKRGYVFSNWYFLFISVLTIFVFLSKKATQGLPFERPVILNQPFISVISIVWFILILSGLVCFWQINPFISIVIVVILGIFGLLIHHLNGEENKVNRIFTIYRVFKANLEELR